MLNKIRQLFVVIVCLFVSSDVFGAAAVNPYDILWNMKQNGITEERCEELVRALRGQEHGSKFVLGLEKAGRQLGHTAAQVIVVSRATISGPWEINMSLQTTTKTLVLRLMGRYFSLYDTYNIELNVTHSGQVLPSSEVTTLNRIVPDGTGR